MRCERSLSADLVLGDPVECLADPLADLSSQYLASLKRAFMWVSSPTFISLRAAYAHLEKAIYERSISWPIAESLMTCCIIVRSRDFALMISAP